MCGHTLQAKVNHSASVQGQYKQTMEEWKICLAVTAEQSRVRNHPNCDWEYAMVRRYQARNFHIQPSCKRQGFVAAACDSITVVNTTNIASPLERLLNLWTTQVPTWQLSTHPLLCSLTT